MRKQKEDGTGKISVSVYCSKEERDALKLTAQRTGLSVSQYLLRVGLGYQPESVVDYQKCEELLKFAADLGRLGGLLKWWLSGTAPVLKTAWGAEIEITAPMLRSALSRIEKASSAVKKAAEQIVTVKVGE